MEANTTFVSPISNNTMCNECPSSVQLYDTLLRTSLISVQAVCIFITFALTFIIFHFRKYKGIAGSAWILLELILIGALLLYSMVIVRYFDASAELCLMEPWLRELGFTFCYGTIVLKIYRLLVEFRTRKAHRWVVREKDLLKYLAVMIACVVVYLTSGTISTLQHSDYSLWTSNNGNTHLGMNISRPLFPKSVAMKTESTGIRVRGDGPRTYYSNASFLLQKARVLRREIELENRPDTSDLDNSSSSLSNASWSVHPSHHDDSNWTESTTTTWLSTANQSKCDSVPEWTVVQLLLARNDKDNRFLFYACRQLWWHYINMAGEFIFLITGLYISYSARNAASHHGEKLCLFLAISCEFVVSCVYTVLSRISWIIHHPDYIFLLEFARSQLATTLVLAVIFGPKLYFVCRQSSSKQQKDLHHQASQMDGDTVQIPPDSEIFKIQETAGIAVSANGEMDLGNVDLSQMDPEVIREELKRVYTQLHVLKMKTLRKDNPHISKRRGGRKLTHRKFSLQRSRVSREKNKSNRSTRGVRENVEEGGVEESVCSIDGPSTVVADTSMLTEAGSSNVKNSTRF